MFLVFFYTKKHQTSLLGGMVNDIWKLLYFICNWAHQISLYVKSIFFTVQIHKKTHFYLKVYLKTSEYMGFIFECGSFYGKCISRGLLKLKRDANCEIEFKTGLNFWSSLYTWFVAVHLSSKHFGFSTHFSFLLSWTNGKYFHKSQNDTRDSMNLGLLFA